MARQPSGRPTGRPPIEVERSVHTVKVPVVLTEKIRADAKAAGKSLNDWFVEAAMSHLGIPFDHQERLEIAA